MLQNILQDFIHQLSTQQEVQVLTGIIAGAVFLMLLSMIGISIRIINRKKREAHNPLGNIVVTTTLPVITEKKESDHILYKNKVLNQTEKSKTETTQSNGEDISVEISEPKAEVIVSVKEEPVPVISEIKEPAPIEVEKKEIVKEPTVETSIEEKKKQVLQAIQETKSREENLRLLEERLKELRGKAETKTETETVKEREPEKEPETVAEKIIEKEPVTEVEIEKVKESEKEVSLHTKISSAPAHIDATPKTFSDWLGSLSEKKRK